MLTLKLNITLVGQVESVEINKSNLTYVIDDGTGQVEARYWKGLGEDEDDSVWESIKCVY